ncbi:MAG: hypothetical protein Q9170_001079 [Blastenia crenularia]
MAPTLLELLVLLCYLAQVPLITVSLLFTTALNLWLVPANDALEPFIYLAILAGGFSSLAVLIAEIIILIRNNPSPHSRSIFYLQCGKNLVWIAIIAYFGYVALSHFSTHYWPSEAWSYLVWTVLGIFPFLAGLLFALFGGNDDDAEGPEIMHETTPLLQNKEVGA